MYIYIYIYICIIRPFLFGSTPWYLYPIRRSGSTRRFNSIHEFNSIQLQSWRFRAAGRGTNRSAGPIELSWSVEFNWVGELTLGIRIQLNRRREAATTSACLDATTRSDSWVTSNNTIPASDPKITSISPQIFPFFKVFFFVRKIILIFWSLYLIEGM